ncbi:60S ribosomal protein L7 [Neocallimastix sp. 'constans']
MAKELGSKGFLKKKNNKTSSIKIIKDVVLIYYLKTTNNNVLKTAENTVSEVLLKKRKHLERVKAERAAAAILKKQKKGKAPKKTVFKRAEQFVREYRTLENENKRLERLAKSNKKLDVPEEPTLAFVIRVRGHGKLPDKIKKIFKLLKLNNLYNGRFIKLNKATVTMLNMIQPYVVYGTPNIKSVRELIYKRGYTKVKNEKVPLTDNTLIEKELGKYNIICMEDIVHEIFTLGPNFKYVNNFLYAFKLVNPNNSILGKKGTPFISYSETGNRGDEINDLIQKMN